jgi:hypothetical protein
MKRKLLLIMAAVLVSLASNAQFEEGKVYANASMSGLNMNYNGKGFNLGVQGQVGYLFSDDMMLLASASFNHQGQHRRSRLLYRRHWIQILCHSEWSLFRSKRQTRSCQQQLQRRYAGSGSGLLLLPEPHSVNRTCHLLRPVV